MKLFIAVSVAEGIKIINYLSLLKTDTAVLELRPNCENCNKPLPPDSKQALICTYECTWCTDCNENILHNVCPNCGGNLQPRPIRPKTELETNPASKTPVHKPIDLKKFLLKRAELKDIAAKKR